MWGNTDHTIQTVAPMPRCMGYAASQGQFQNLGLWNTTQNKMKELLEESGQGTLDAYLLAQFKVVDGVFEITVQGEATRNISEEHPAFEVLSRKGVGRGSNFNLALKQALESY